MTTDIHQIKLNYFLGRLDEDSVCDIIREINKALSTNSGNDSLLSDPWEDMNVGINFPNFYIEDLTLSLADMKHALYERLGYIKPGYHDFFDDIEETNPKSIRQGWLLKFKYSIDEKGYRKNFCESLTNFHRPLSFVQICRLKDCQYILRQIDKALKSKVFDRKPFSNRKENLLIKIAPPWFTIGNRSNSNGLSVGLESAKQFLEEWIAFVNN